MNLPTIAVNCLEAPSGYQLINGHEYDGEIHILYDPEAKREANKKKRVAEYVGTNDKD